MPELFLAIQNTYEHLEIALFNQAHLIDMVKEDKMNASKQFVTLLDALLTRNDATFKNILFIAANQGPGPFSTLRTVIASANGLSFARSLPLIGIDGLEALLMEHQDTSHPFTVALLNAFNKDVYFGIQRKNEIIAKGYKKNLLLFQELHAQVAQETIRFIGNGAELYKSEILETFGERAYIPKDNPNTCSIEQVGKIGWQQWREQRGLSTQLFPLYLKTHPAQELLNKKKSN